MSKMKLKKPTKQDIRGGICSCSGLIESYSFATEVIMRDPHGGLVGIDVCIASEIGKLWMSGIETVECCCGHGHMRPSVIVKEESIPKMEQLGYRHYTEAFPEHDYIFVLANRQLPIKEENPYAENWKDNPDRLAWGGDEAEVLRYMREMDEETLLDNLRDSGTLYDRPPFHFPALYELKRRGAIVIGPNGWVHVPESARSRHGS
jgi:hypothetical protein